MWKWKGILWNTNRCPRCVFIGGLQQRIVGVSKIGMPFTLSVLAYPGRGYPVASGAWRVSNKLKVSQGLSIDIHGECTSGVFKGDICNTRGYRRMPVTKVVSCGYLEDFKFRYFHLKYTCNVLQYISRFRFGVYVPGLY